MAATLALLSALLLSAAVYMTSSLWPAVCVFFGVECFFMVMWIIASTQANNLRIITHKIVSEIKR